MRRWRADMGYDRAATGWTMAMTTRSLSGWLGLATVALLLLPAGRARADAIDGEWCYPDGRHMSIQGPNIVTPGGTAITGNYARHYFSYVVPPAEPGAGQTVAMTLMNEYTVNLRVGAGGANAAQAAVPVEVWHRCAPTTSGLSPVYMGAAPGAS